MKEKESNITDIALNKTITENKQTVDNAIDNENDRKKVIVP